MHVRTGFDNVPYTGLEAGGLGLDVFDFRTWPGFSKAWDYLRGKVQEFYTLPARIGAIKQRAATLLTVAKRKGASTAGAEVQAILDGTREVEAKHRQTAGKVSEAMSTATEHGLGVIPWLAISAIMTAAAGIKWLLNRVANDEHKLDMIEQGLLTPAEAAALSSNGLLPKVLDFSKYALPVAGVAAAWFLLRGRL